MRRTLVKAVVLGLAMTVLYFAWIALSQSANPAPVCEVPVVVEVLNGCGVVGIAEKVGEFLVDRGFDVMFVGNADDFSHTETLIVDRSGDRTKALAVASTLPRSGVIYQVSSSFFVDVTVVIGRDLAASLPADGE
jgi:hypothetical protein